MEAGMTYHKMALGKAEANTEAEKCKLQNLQAGWAQVNGPDTANLLRELLQPKYCKQGDDNPVISISKLTKWVKESDGSCVWVGPSVAATTRAKELGYLAAKVSASNAPAALDSVPSSPESSASAEAEASSSAVATVVERVERAARMSVSATASVAQLETAIKNLSQTARTAGPGTTVAVKDVIGALHRQAEHVQKAADAKGAPVLISSEY
jgi:hypothetical protein